MAREDKPLEPQFVWPGMKPDVEDWDENFPEKLGHGILSVWQRIWLYYLLPGAILPAAFLPAALTLVVFKALGAENGSTAMVLTAGAVGGIVGFGWARLVIRDWRRYGFLRNRWPLPQRREW